MKKVVIAFSVVGSVAVVQRRWRLRDHFAAVGQADDDVVDAHAVVIRIVRRGRVAELQLDVRGAGELRRSMRACRQSSTYPPVGSAGFTSGALNRNWLPCSRLPEPVLENTD